MYSLQMKKLLKQEIIKREYGWEKKQKLNKLTQIFQKSNQANFNKLKN